MNQIAYGFYGLQHLFSQRLTQVGVAQVNAAVTESAAEWTRITSSVLAGLTERTTLAKERFLVPASGTLQPLDEYGNPLPVREEGAYDVAYPIQRGGTAWGGNRETNALMTVDEVNRQVVAAMQRDGDWLRRHVLAALFDNAAWTYTDPLLGSLTIKPLANGDTDVYVRRDGSAQTAQHYLAQAGAIADASNPFPTIYQTLKRYPSNTGAVVVFVPTNVVSAVEGLSAFVPVRDADIQPGGQTDTLRSDGEAIRGMGDRVLGKVDGCWAVEWGVLPDNYLLATVEGRPPLAMREQPAPELQGFFTETFSPDGNRQETRLIRIAGFGVRNRIAALAYRVSGAPYAIPTGYDAPLAV